MERIKEQGDKMRAQLDRQTSLDRQTLDDEDEEDESEPSGVVEVLEEMNLLPVELGGWERDLRGNFVAYRFVVQLEGSSGPVHFMIRYSDAANKHKQVMKSGCFSSVMARYDDSSVKVTPPPFPPRSPLKDMVNNDANAEERGQMLRLYFARIFVSDAVRGHPSWAKIFTAGQASAAKPEGGADGAVSEFVKLELQPGEWTNKWLLVSPTTLRIRDSDDLSVTSAFELSIPVTACSIKPQPRTKRLDAPYSFRVDVTDLTLVEGIHNTLRSCHGQNRGSVQ